MAVSPEMNVSKIMAGEDPAIPIYHIEVLGPENSGLWPETFGSLEQLEAFIRGVKAGVAMFGGYIDDPMIPR